MAVHFAKEIRRTSNIDVRGKIHTVLRCAARTVYRDCDLPQPLQLPFVIVSVKVQLFWEGRKNLKKISHLFLNLQMDRIATKCNFPKHRCEGWRCHFKGNEDIITKFKWHVFQIIRINRKMFGESGTIKLTKTLLFILKVNNLMQKMNSEAPFVF